MTETGYVTSIRGEYALVSFKRKSGCGDNCASCKGGCVSPGVTTEIENTLGAKIGDQVKVEMQQKAFNKMLLWVYVFPLIMLAIGIGAGTKVFGSLGYGNAEILSFLLGVGALAISYWVLNKVSRKTAEKEEFTLRMTQIVG
ncbi:sigma-E factor regulator, RseC/MucC family protein [Clostridium bovifaecis]|uniref:Sigma-E factor regulator, RseC/MucC family protein n=1 Tax=Clostridium bovifaecis TaxID=2184719 RepID=A0A6I6F4Y6_9CLOT|nr:sigma-E factor regulator, RseC/MucC family protein [Clostridium bovifaecis]